MPEERNPCLTDPVQFICSSVCCVARRKIAKKNDGGAGTENILQLMLVHVLSAER